MSYIVKPRKSQYVTYFLAFDSNIVPFRLSIIGLILRFVFRNKQIMETKKYLTEIALLKNNAIHFIHFSP